MASVEELIIKLTVDNANLKSKLTDSKKSVDQFSGGIGKLAPMIAGAFSVGAVLAFGKAAYTAFEEQEKANKRLMFALKGNETSYKILTEQAAELQSKTGVEEESIQQIQMLAIGAGQSTSAVKELVTASMALSAATGIDLQAAYMQLSGTLNGVAGKSIPKMGAEFSNLTVEQLKSGDAIRLLNDKYGTLAETSATSTSKLKANWGELMESIGGGISKVVTPALEALNSMIDEMNTKEGFMQKFATFMGNLLPGGNTLSMSFDAVNSTKKLQKEDAFMGPMPSSIGGVTTFQRGGGGGNTKGTESKKENPFLFMPEADAQASLKTAVDYIKSATKFEDDWNADVTKGIEDSLEDQEALYTDHYRKLYVLKTKNAKKEQNLDKMTADMKVSVMGDAFGMAASLFDENTAAYKAFASGQVIMDTARAVMGVWASFSELGPYGVAAAAVMTGLIVATGAKQLATINGFAQGGIVGGNSFTGDRVNARVNSGEMILNSTQQAQLFSVANGSGGGRVQIYGKLKAGDIYLSNKQGAYQARRRGTNG